MSSFKTVNAEFTRNKIAVLDFMLQGNGFESKDLCIIVAEWLITALVKEGRFDVIERQMLKKIVAEQQLSETGLLDRETTSKLGKILGVEVFISGSVIRIQDNIEVNARIIDVESGSILAAESVGDTDVRQLKKLVEQMALKIIAAFPLEGYIVARQNEHVTIDLGRINGVKPGMEFIVYKEGEVIKSPQTGEVIEVKKKRSGFIHIRNVLNKLSEGYVVREIEPEAIRYGQMVKSTAEDLDGKIQKGIHLDSGKYHIEVAAPSYQPKIQWIEVLPGEKKTVLIALVKAEAGKVTENKPEKKSEVDVRKKANADLQKQTGLRCTVAISPKPKQTVSTTPRMVQNTTAGTVTAKKTAQVSRIQSVGSKNTGVIRDSSAGVTAYLKAYLGIGIKDENKGGATVTKVYDHSVASAYGIKVNDIILAIDGIPTPREKVVLEVMKNRAAPNQDVVLSIIRDGEHRDLHIKLGGRIQQVALDSTRNRAMLWGKDIDLNYYDIEIGGSKMCRSEFEVVTVTVNDGAKQAIKWHYTPHSPGSAFLLIRVEGMLDASSFNAVTFKVKAEKAYNFFINPNKLDCYVWSKTAGGKYYKDSDDKRYRGGRHFTSDKFKVTNQWQQIRLPLSSFTGISTWLKNKIKNMGGGLDLSKIWVFGFDSYNNENNNTVYITDIGFVK